ncbi:methylenetetrahydrofolate reductase [Paenibacillus yanchengensis]|uniref:Methylenetetrahydrofolate reductase n=1 Tax=Paenibacillus yanchengensis TaxID=2035833 RepID=A0ABW4YQU6_9BACL
MLGEKIKRKQAGILTYGMTPPKESNGAERIAEIATLQQERLANIPIDGLILYDVQEESERIEENRPFPFMRTVDPFEFSERYLDRLEIPKIVYRCVGKHTIPSLYSFITAKPGQSRYSVYVGPSSSKERVQTSLGDAYQWSKQINEDLVLGGVVIPERHMVKNDEHIRINTKVKQGCQYFISQATFNVEASKNFLSDYYYHCKQHELEFVPILFNLAPCGSLKTLEFMKWLGISIPKWLDNDLKHSRDVLERSVRESQKIFEELYYFGLEKGIPIGCSVESLSTRKVEIEASIELLNNISSFMKNADRSTSIAANQ